MSKGIVKPDDQEPNTEGFQFYFDAFHELSTARQFGMAIGPIPFTAVADYFTIYDIEGDFFEFAAIIRHMDSVYLKLNADELKKTSKQDKGKAKSGNTNADKKNLNQG